jgi:hypothetical protein
MPALLFYCANSEPDVWFNRSASTSGAQSNLDMSQLKHRKQKPPEGGSRRPVRPIKSRSRVGDISANRDRQSDQCNTYRQAGAGRADAVDASSDDFHDGFLGRDRPPACLLEPSESESREADQQHRPGRWLRYSTSNDGGSK